MRPRTRGTHPGSLDVPLPILLGPPPPETQVVVTHPRPIEGLDTPAKRFGRGGRAREEDASVTRAHRSDRRWLCRQRMKWPFPAGLESSAPLQVHSPDYRGYGGAGRSEACLLDLLDQGPGEAARLPSRARASLLYNTLVQTRTHCGEWTTMPIRLFDPNFRHQYQNFDDLTR